MFKRAMAGTALAAAAVFTTAGAASAAVSGPHQDRAADQVQCKYRNDSGSKAEIVADDGSGRRPGWVQHPTGKVKPHGTIWAYRDVTYTGDSGRYRKLDGQRWVHTETLNLVQGQRCVT